MLFSTTLLLLGAGCMGVQQPVPFAMKGPVRSDEEMRVWNERNERLRQLEAERKATAAAQGDTAAIDVEIDRLRGELKSEEIAYQDQSLAAFIPAMKDFIADETIYSESLGPAWEMTAHQADALMDYLYRDLGHPSANYRVQLLAFSDIQPRLEDPNLPPDVRERFHARLSAFHAAGGGQAAPEIMAALGQSLFLVSDPGDASAQTALDLMNKAQEWAGALGLVSDQQKFLQASRRLQEQRKSDEEIIAITGDESVSAQSLSALSVTIIKDFSLVEGNDRSLRLLLKEYRRLLRKPDLRQDLIAQIEADLIAIAKSPSVRDKHNWRLWNLWAQVAGCLRDRATRMRAFVKSEGERLSTKKSTAKSDHAKAMSYVARKCD